MGRLQHLVLAGCLLAVGTLALCAVPASASSLELPTLLETAVAASAEWAPAGRTRLEKLAQTQTPRPAEALAGNNGAQALFFGADSNGHPLEQIDRSKEPQADVFNGATPPAAPAAPKRRALKKRCDGPNCDGPKALPPRFIPPPRAPKPAPPADIPEKPTHRPFPHPPAPELPLATPPPAGCGDLCNPDAKDPVLARVPAPPLGDEAIAAVGLEGKTLASVKAKMKNREGWLRAQKLWLSKAVEAAGTIRREIDLAKLTMSNVVSDLEQLAIAQDQLSVKYKADTLKWAFKDKKATLEKLQDKDLALKEARADVGNQMITAKDEVRILENTLGPPSQQVQIAPEELEDPLKFLNDVIAEHESNDYTKF